VTVAFNATAYDARASGARSRCVGLAAALLRAGEAVRLYVPHGLSLADAVAVELGSALPADSFAETPTPFESSAPIRRAARSRRWFESRVRSDAGVFVTDFYPVLAGTTTALTVHDLRYLAAPEFEPRSRVAWFRAFYPRMARRARLLVVPTQAVARECAEILQADPARIAVAPNGLMRAWREAPPASGPREHLLMVGFVERRKDLATLLAALRRAPSAPPLVVAGRGRPPREADDLVAAGRVRFAGFVDDATLVGLCRRAVALVPPSRYAGFGMPVIEAMSVGVPVVAARCDAVAEVAGGFAALLPPGDVGAWAAAISSPPARPDPAARDHARAYSWDRAAKALRDAARCVASAG
jgi:glycosyltransferase involved in cell wall biosynthesis